MALDRHPIWILKQNIFNTIHSSIGKNQRDRLNSSPMNTDMMQWPKRVALHQILTEQETFQEWVSFHKSEYIFHFYLGVALFWDAMQCHFLSFPFKKPEFLKICLRNFWMNKNTTYFMNWQTIRFDHAYETQFSLHNHKSAWWRHEMESCSALPALCEGNSLVTGEFPSQRPVTRSFDVFFDLRLSKQ